MATKSDVRSCPAWSRIERRLWPGGTGFVLTMMVMGVMLVVPQFAASLDWEWDVNASWLGIGSHMTIPVAFSVDPDAHRIVAPTIGVNRGEVLNAHGSLRFPARSVPFLYSNVVLLIVLFVAASWVLHELRAVLRILRDGWPFVARNATAFGESASASSPLKS